MVRWILMTSVGLSLAGCGYDVAQPRMQVGQVSMPTCTILCQITVQVNDVEGNRIRTNGAATLTENNTAGAMTSRQSGGIGKKTDDD